MVFKEFVGSLSIQGMFESVRITRHLFRDNTPAEVQVPRSLLTHRRSTSVQSKCETFRMEQSSGWLSRQGLVETLLKDRIRFCFQGIPGAVRCRRAFSMKEITIDLSMQVRDKAPYPRCFGELRQVVQVWSLVFIMSPPSVVCKRSAHQCLGL